MTPQFAPESGTSPSTMSPTCAYTAPVMAKMKWIAT